MSRYTLLGSPYVRIAALPVDKFPKKGSSALSVFADTVISEPGIRAVLENSAPSFYAAVTKNLAEDSKTERTKVLKVARSALKYLSRLTTRATPFSTFATVGVLENVVSNPDGLELEVGQRRILERIAVGIDDIEKTFTFNPSAYLLGERLYIPSPSKSQETISVRYSEAVQAVKQVTEGRLIGLEQLSSTLATKFGTSEGLSAFIDGLIDSGILLAAPISYQMRDWKEDLASSDVTSTVQLFSLARFSGTFPSNLIDDTGLAIELMGRLFSFSTQNRNIESFTERYISRYGNFRFPANQVIDNYDGIGLLPPLESEDLQPAGQGKARFDLTNKFLSEVIFTNSDKSSIDLSRYASRILREWPAVEFASSYDVILKVEKVNSQTCESSTNFVFDDIGTIPLAGRAMARFAELSAEMKNNHREIVTRASGLERTERLPLLYRYNSPRPDFLSGNSSVSGNALSLGFLPHVEQAVSIVGLSDISVFESSGKMYCFDERHQKVANIHLPGLVNQDLLSGIGRSLVQISQMNQATPYWSWLGYENHANHLPEIRLGVTILSREKWKLTNRGIGALDDLKRVLADRRVPRYIYAGASDNKILLDTSAFDHLRLLKHVIENSDEDIWIERGVEPEDLGVTKSESDDKARFATEIVISVSSTDWAETATLPVAQIPPVGLNLDLSKRSVLESSTAFTFVVLCNDSNQERVLATAFDVLDDAGLEAYFVRYSEEGRPSLRIRVRGSFDDTFIRVFCDSVLSLRLATDVEFNLRLPEYSRYGGPECFKYLESFWCLESTQLVKMFTRLSSDTPEQVQKAKSNYMRFLIQQLGFTRHYVSAVAESYEHEFEADRHSIRKAARALRSVFSSDDMPEVFTDEMQEVLARFSSCQLQSNASAQDVKQSIAHMSANRLGLDRKDEAIFWRALLNHLRSADFGGEE